MPMIVRTGIFITILAVYWGMGWLNFQQAGKSALIGSLAILAVSAWTGRKSTEGRGGRFLNLAVLTPFLAIVGFQAFLRDIYGVAHDDLMVTEALFSTNSTEASEFLLQNVGYILKHLGVLLAAIGFFAFITKRLPLNAPPHPRTSRRYRRLAALFLFLFLFIHLNPTMRKQDPLLYFPLRYAKWQKQVEHVRQVQEKLSAATASDPGLDSLRYEGSGPRTVVFVLGESTTRLNWSMYGYSRQTTPRLESLDRELGDQLLRFTDVVTTNGSTVLDMQKILTPATLDNPGLWEEKPDVLTMAKKAGYKTFWITNHSTDTTGVLSIFANHADRMVLTNSGGSRGEGSLDEVVIPHLEEALEDPAERKFIVLHLLGGHPAYIFRYPQSFARFNDAQDDVTRDLQTADRAFWAIKMRNYYDNAMLYTDHVLSETLELCRRHGTRQPVAWLFAPDHGEDVAHYSNFVGHNPRVPSMYEIPMLFWRSENFSLPIQDPKELEPRPYQLDELDHTLLGLLEVRGDYYNSRRDIFSRAFLPELREVAGTPYLPRAIALESTGNEGSPEKAKGPKS